MAFQSFFRVSPVNREIDQNSRFSFLSSKPNNGPKLSKSLGDAPTG